MPLVAVHGIGVRFGGVDALRDVTIDVEPGERVALLGPSGAGKTTLLRVLAGDVIPDVGTARILGEDLGRLRGRRVRRIRRRIGSVHQHDVLIGSLRVIHNVNAGRLGVWSTAQAVRSLVTPSERHDVGRALAAVGIDDRIDAPTSTLSGGQRQRVAIARLMVQDPDLVLADEPLAGLDPTTADTVLALLCRQVGTEDRAMVLSLHDPALALAHCTRVIGLRDGQVLFDAPPEAASGCLDRLYEA